VGLLVTQRMINLPSETVPALHSELAADLAFTKKCDDIEDPRQFDYSHLLVITRYTIPKAGDENVKTTSSGRCFYNFEDAYFVAEAECSFSFMSTFKVFDDENKKSWKEGINGTNNNETQYRLIYLIKWSRY